MGESCRISCSPPSVEAYSCHAGDSPRGGCLHASNNPRTQFIWNDCSLRCGKPKRQQFIETRITAQSIVDNSPPQAIFDFVCIATNMFPAIHDSCCSGDVLLTQDTRHGSGVRNRSFFMSRQKKTPPKAGSLGFSLGVLPSFHSVKKPSTQLNIASEIGMSKTLVSVD
jgi:hypothetical protein